MKKNELQSLLSDLHLPDELEISEALQDLADYEEEEGVDMKIDTFIERFKIRRRYHLARKTGLCKDWQACCLLPVNQKSEVKNENQK